jgi:hypothetical protein
MPKKSQINEYSDTGFIMTFEQERDITAGYREYSI